MSTTPTGSTIPPITYPPPQTCDISGCIDSFFQNIATAFEILAQVINLVYLDPPLDQKQVYFDSLVDTFHAAPTYRAEPLTNLLTNVKNAQWYLESKPYRNCATHHRSIQFKVLMESEPITYQSQIINAILLCDDPDSNVPTYQLKRDSRIFGTNVLNQTLTVMDSSLSLIENKVQAADKIPV